MATAAVMFTSTVFGSFEMFTRMDGLDGSGSGRPTAREAGAVCAVRGADSARTDPDSINAAMSLSFFAIPVRRENQRWANIGELVRPGKHQVADYRADRTRREPMASAIHGQPYCREVR